MAEAAKVEAKKGRAKKGEGPYSVLFVDADNKDVPRIPANVTAMKLVEKGGKSKSYSLAGLSPAILHQLAVDGLRRRIDAFVRNSIGGDKTAIVLADEMFGNIKSGKLYLKGEGKGGAGRSFDFDLWVSAIERTAQLKAKADKSKKKQPATEKQLAALRAKLESATPADRSTMIKNWKNDPIFALAKKQIDAERASKNVKEAKDSDVDALADLF